MNEPDIALLRHETRVLSGIHRPSASDGERQAAELIAGWFREAGCETRIEAERAHGNYWLPLGLMSAGGLLGGLLGGRSGRRLLPAAVAAAAAAGVYEDISGCGHHGRRLLPARTTHNVLASLGDPDASRTLLLIAHHDAARSGLIFHPGIPELAWKFAPGQAKRKSSPPVMAPVLAGPVLAALGALGRSRKLAYSGALISAASAAAFCQIGASQVVPGANDNISGVVCLLELARLMACDPPRDLRILLLSTGSEESLMEGMAAFARRHFRTLDRERTFALCVDTVGSRNLCVLAGEGMIRMRDYPPKSVALLEGLADELGIEQVKGLRLRNSTDGLYPLKAGFPCAMLGSVSEKLLPENYHWPSDTHERVRYETVADAVRLCRALAQRLEGPWPADLAVGR